MSNTILPNPFVPTSIPGCVCWLDATDRSTLFQNTAGTTPVTGLGQQVQFIRDKSASGNNFSTINTVVTYNTGMVGTTLPSLYNAVAMSNGWTGSVTIPANSTYFHVKCLTEGNAVYFYHQGTSRLKQTWNYFNGSSFVSQWDYNGQPGPFGVTNRVNVTDVITRQDIASPCTLTGWETGNIRGPGGYSQAQVPVQTYSAITLWGGGATGWYGELIIFNTALAPSDRERVEGYLAWKWGAQAQLPSSTPYKNTPAAIITAPNILPILNTTNRLTNASFLPTSIPGCQLWLDASDINSLFQNTAGTTPVTSAGQQIQFWKDKSGNARNATSSDTAMTYNTSGIKYPSIYFTGAQATGFQVNVTVTDSTYFFVVNNSATAAASRVYNSHSGTSRSKLNYWDTIYRTRMDYNNFPGLTGPDTTSGVTLVMTRQDTVSNGLLNGWQTGTLMGSGNATPIIGETFTSFVLGTYNGGSSFPMIGYMGEVIVYNSVLTTSERQQVEGYLAWKWGVEANLPLTHPYKNSSAVFVTQANLLALLGTRSYNNTLLSGYFNPRTISGLQIWFDGADPLGTGSAPSNATTISTWADKSGNARNAPATGTPTYSAKILNGIGAPLLNGSTSYFITPSFIPSPTGIPSIFIVMRQTSYVSGNSDFFLASDYRVIDLLGQGNNYNAALTIGNSAQTPLTAINATLNPTLLSVIVTAGVGGVGYANGTYVATTGSSGGGLASSYAYYIGGGPGFIGYIYEVMMYNSSLSTAQRQQVEGYLAWKWGIQGNLPATHPFKNFPPPP